MLVLYTSVVDWPSHHMVSYNGVNVRYCSSESRLYRGGSVYIHGIITHVGRYMYFHRISTGCLCINLQGTGPTVTAACRLSLDESLRRINCLLSTLLVAHCVCDRAKTDAFCGGMLRVYYVRAVTISNTK